MLERGAPANKEGNAAMYDTTTPKTTPDFFPIASMRSHKHNNGGL